MHLVAYVYFLASLGMGLAHHPKPLEARDDLSGFQHDLINHTRIDDATGIRWRCTNAAGRMPDPNGPLVSDCREVLDKYKALTGDITLQWSTGCYKITCGTCTGSVCPQSTNSVTFSPGAAAKSFEDPVMSQCIDNGFTGWWTDTKGLGIGLYMV